MESVVSLCGSAGGGLGVWHPVTGQVEVNRTSSSHGMALRAGGRMAARRCVARTSRDAVVEALGGQRGVVRPGGDGRCHRDRCH